MKAAIGQDSHRFEEGYGKPLILGGVVFPGETGLLANSDGDVVLHAIQCRFRYYRAEYTGQGGR